MADENNCDLPASRADLSFIFERGQDVFHTVNMANRRLEQTINKTPYHCDFIKVLL